VNVWTKAGWTGVNGHSANPRKTAFKMKTEVERILQDHDDGSMPDGSGGRTDTTLDYMAPGGSRRFVEDSEDPEETPKYRYQVTAGYGYTGEPE